MSHTPSQQRPLKKSRLEVTHSVGYKYAPRFWIFDDEYLYGPSRTVCWPHDRPLETEIEWSEWHGVYAWKELQLLYDWLAKNQIQPVIVGMVQLWGSIVEHETGWRAQFGRVHTLNVKVIEGRQVPEDNYIRHLRRNYGLATEGERACE